MRKALIAVAVVAMLVFASAAMAAKTGQAKPWVYDPGKIGGGVAAWTKDGLRLEKNVPTSELVAAGAEFKGVAGEPLTTLSFDVKNGKYCGAGAPRFNVYTDAGTAFLGCIHGEQTDLGDGWTHVVFTGDEVGVAAGTFGSIINGVDVMVDEQGQTLLRNITVNGLTVTK